LPERVVPRLHKALDGYLDGHQQWPCREDVRFAHARRFAAPSQYGKLLGTCTSAVAAETITTHLDGEDTRTVRRTTGQAVRSIKAHRPCKAAHVS
jgi:hypothetical protein